MTATVEVLSPAMRKRLTNRLVKEHGMTVERASFCVDEMVSYFQQLAKRPNRNLIPTDEADTGWHTFLLYTREYAAFCQATCGHFVHHTPWDEADCAYPDLATVNAQLANGEEVNADLMGLELMAVAGASSFSTCSKQYSTCSK